MRLKENIVEILKVIDVKNNLKLVDVHELSQINEITIIRTAGVHILERLLKTLYSHNPTIKINVIMKDNNIDALSQKYPDLEFIIYEYEGHFETEKLKYIIENNDSKNILIMYQNLWGTDYSNIEASLIGNQDKSVYFWNKADMLLTCDNVELKIANDKMMKELIEWYSVYRENWSL